MATLLLQTAGAALGGVFGPLGAMVGRAAGALAGSAIDRALIGGSTLQGPRLAGGRVPTSQEGAGIARLYGTARIAGNLIWATRFEEEVTRERQGGKGGGQRVESFRYYGNFAIGLCEGEIAGIRRIWADGREIDQSDHHLRVYRGTGDQLPDPLIEAKQGEGRTPAFRHLAYVVFERFPLDGFGNRIPVLHFEVIRPIGRLERELRAITVIPGATEHGYAARPVTEALGPGESRVMNRHVLFGATDWQASIDELQAVCPKLERVALVVTWFGDDLRAGECRIRPGVEVSQRLEESRPWRVAGEERAQARLVSRIGDAPAYGGTPDDASVIEAIADLKARGLSVFLYPFIMMDVPQGNGLPDPEGAAEQPAHPWRGRITCHPAPGRDGTADRTALARSQIEAFCGAVEGSDFLVSGSMVSAPAGDFRYRHLILHYAHLAAAAGGVDGFIVGSEMRALTRVRDGDDRFPFVEELTRLAGDVRAVLGAESGITYAADWSEYSGYRPQDGSGDVYYNLDPLWMSEAVTAIGIDNYMPLSDWRESDLTQGNPDGFFTATDAAALRNGITSGEGFDWYYPGAAERSARSRVAITDGSAAKPWVFRDKDIGSWWSNPHFERRGGVEMAEPTLWQPRAKPVWLTELGCPAIDGGAGQPNVFPDAKSSEGELPHASSGARSDLVQRRFIEAHLEHWASDAAPAGMIDPGFVFAWTWDARPFPAFPVNGSLWSDGPNWRAGHWLNGRLGTVAAADLVAAILADHGFTAGSVEDLGTDLVGYVQADPASARALLDPLIDLFQAEALERGETLTIRSRTRRVSLPITLENVVDHEGEPLVERSLAHVSDLVNEASLDHFDIATDYEPATARSRRLEGETLRQRRLAAPLGLFEEAAVQEVDFWLRDHWSQRAAARFALSPADIRIEPGDVVVLPGHGETPFRVARISDETERRIEARGFAPAVSTRRDIVLTMPSGRPPAAIGWTPDIHLLDLPVLEGADERAWARAAAFGLPWRPVALSSSAGDEDYRIRATLTAPARMGVLVEPLHPGTHSGRFDSSRAIFCRIDFGGLATVGDTALFNGANALAIRTASQGWEIVQFSEAEEIDQGLWRLRRLLRGQAGTEDAMATGAPAGAPVILLDHAVVPLGLTAGEAGRPLNWRAASGGHARALAGAEILGLRALTPLAPVHLRGARRADGAVELRWVRRGRFDADGWLAADIPLDAPRERYRVEILAGTQLHRSIDVDTPRLIYASEDELHDFGVAQDALTVRVRQHGGGAVPLGLPATRTIRL